MVVTGGAGGNGWQDGNIWMYGVCGVLTSASVAQSWVGVSLKGGSRLTQDIFLTFEPCSVRDTCLGVYESLCILEGVYVKLENTTVELKRPKIDLNNQILLMFMLSII